MHARTRSKLRTWISPVTLFAALALLVAYSQIWQVPIARAYSCAYPYVHCYGIMTWYPSGDDGGESNIAVVQLSCFATQCGQYGWTIDNEMWLNGTNTLYWVEVGYSTFSNKTTVEDYFWADSRPGLGYAEHNMGAVPTGDYNHYSQFQIYGECCNDYAVFMYGYSGDQFWGTSTANTMTPGSTVMGQELNANGYASAAEASFIDNGWIDTGGTGHYFTSSGDPSYHKPPYGSYASSSTGGTLDTWCC